MAELVMRGLPHGATISKSAMLMEPTTRMAAHYEHIMLAYLHLRSEVCEVWHLGRSTQSLAAVFATTHTIRRMEIVLTRDGDAADFADR